MRIRFRHLSTFLEVARQKSVSQAAEHLHVSQPAVTKTIRELEELLDVKLLEKDGRGIRISQQGEVFLRHASASISAIEKGVESVTVGRASRGATVRIGALPTVAASIMPSAIAACLHNPDDGFIRVITGPNNFLLNQLRVGDLDLVVGRLAAPEQMTALSFEHLYSERIGLFARPSHPLFTFKTFDYRQIRDYPVLMPPPGSIIRPFVDRLLLTFGIEDVPLQVETVSDAFGRSFVQQSDAIWLISAGVVAAEVKSGLIKALPADTSQTQGSVGLTTRAESLPSDQVLRVISEIRSAARKIAAHST